MMFSKFKKGQKAKPPMDQFDDYDPIIEELDNAIEFSLPEEAENLRRAWEHNQSGGIFVVRKSFKAKGIKNKVVARLLHFPSAEEIAEIVEDRFGGGIYTVHPGNSPKILKSYELDGISKFLMEEPAPKASEQNLEDMVEIYAVNELCRRMEEDPEFARIVLTAYCDQAMGTAPPSPEEKDEKNFQELLRRNPLLRERWFQVQLRERVEEIGGKPPTEIDELEQALKLRNQLRDLFGINAPDQSWPTIIRDMGIAILQAAPEHNWFGLLRPVSGPNAGPPGTNPATEPSSSQAATQHPLGAGAPDSPPATNLNGEGGGNSVKFDEERLI